MDAAYKKTLVVTNFFSVYDQFVIFSKGESFLVACMRLHAPLCWSQNFIRLSAVDQLATGISYYLRVREKLNVVAFT